MSKRRYSRFSPDAIEAHIRAKHPHCPPAIVAHVTEMIVGRDWATPVSIGQAFGIAAQAHLRHIATDYDWLLRIRGLTRDEARLIVNPEVAAIIRSWAPDGSESGRAVADPPIAQTSDEALQRARRSRQS